MRPIIALFGLLVPHAAAAEAVVHAVEPMPVEETSGFRLGGAAERAAIAPTAVLKPSEKRPARLSLPLASTAPQTVQPLGPATVFMGDRGATGSDAVEFGTFVSRGAARAGVSVTYSEFESDVTRSEVFFDLSVTEKWSVGVSGVLDNETDDTTRIGQVGLNAEFSPTEGAYLQGGVASAEDYDPVIGLAVGLRF